VRHTQPPFARSFAHSLARSPIHGSRLTTGEGGVRRRATLHHRSPACSPTQVSRLITGDGGSPLWDEATQVHYRGSLLGKGHRRRKRRHRRLHKCTTLNHHSFARSLASALSRFTIGEGGVTGAPRCAMVRSLADSPIHVPRPATEMRAETNSAPGARC
jgi:hypothetical protein